MKKLIGFADGASRGNPGPSSWGISLELPGGKEVAAEGQSIGICTNNVAECHAAIAATQKAIDLGAISFDLNLDSLLIVTCLKDKTEINHRDLSIISHHLIELIDEFKEFDVRYIPRKKNFRADRLANSVLNYEKKIINRL